MKMVKKIVLGLVAAAAVLSFVSCGTREEEGTVAEMIKVNAGSSKATIDAKNDGDFARGFKTLQNKHLDAIMHISNTIHEIDNPTNSLKTNGVMGYIFNLKKDSETNKYSFSIAGIRYNQKSNKVEAYVETFKDVEGDKLESDLPKGTHASGEKTWGTNDFGFELDTLKENNGKIDVWIDVVANDGTSTNRDGAAGTYTVTFYGADPHRTKKGSSGLEYDADAVALATFTIPVADVSNPFVKEGQTEGALTNMQSDIGFYANIQAGQTLTGEWKFDAIKMEAEEIEE